MNSGLRRTEFNSRDRRRNAGVGRKNHNEELEKPRQVNLSACLTIQSPPPGGQNARLDAAATDQQYLEPLGRCPGRSHHAGRTRRGLCLERISHSAEQGLRLDHFPGHVYVHSGDSDAGFRGVCGRIMDEEIRSPPGRHCRRIFLRRWRFPGELLGGTSVLALLLLWIGLGLGYIVPVATLVKWFPDKRGMITGIAVAGFGAGALITAPIASRLILSIGVLKTFAVLGIVYLVAVTVPAIFMKDPPAGYRPPGWQPSEAQKRQRSGTDYTLSQALGRWQWYALWAMLFLNTSAGISIISQAAPMAQEITGVTAAVAAGMVGIISIANGAGRFLWAWFSDL